MSDQHYRFDLKAIAGAPVVDGAGERLGEIGELVVNPEDGYIEYVKLWLDSDFNSRLEVIVPWSQFHLSSDRGHLELNISRDVLQTVAIRNRPH